MNLYRHVVTIKEIKLAQIEKEQVQRKKTISSFLLLPEVKNDLKTLFLQETNSSINKKYFKMVERIKKRF